MAVTVKQIPLKKKNLLPFVKFGINLYNDNPYFVPPLVIDELATLTPDGNPAFEFCEAAAFMAYDGDKPVGRIAGIINRNVNERTGKKELRFGFVDFVDRADVVDSLFEAVEAWGRDRGMTTIVGPMGFSDMDHEGMLIDGFEEMGTMATIYNYPYYPAHMERLGFAKDADWVEFRMTVPDKVPEKMHRIAEIVRSKYGLRTLRYKSRSKLRSDYGQALFDLINEAYDKLYGYSPLTPRQIDHYINMYLQILSLDDVSIIVDKDDKLVGCGITMASLSKALQRSRGKLFPFGWYHLLRAMRGKNDVVDLLLVAISPDYQNKGVNALLFDDLIPNYIRKGYRFAESNLELESNANVQMQWQYFTHRQHRRRRAYRKDIGKNQSAR